MSNWKAADVKRLVKAMETLGKKVIGTEVDREGTIRVLTEDPDGKQRLSSLEEWRRKRGPRAA